jgi:hypothetical protein
VKTSTTSSAIAQSSPRQWALFFFTLLYVCLEFGFNNQLLKISARLSCSESFSRRQRNFINTGDPEYSTFDTWNIYLFCFIESGAMAGHVFADFQDKIGPVHFAYSSNNKHHFYSFLALQFYGD